MTSDPWTNASYLSLPLYDYAGGELVVDYGFSFNQTNGKVLVIHDYTGARVICAVINK